MIKHIVFFKLSEDGKLQQQTIISKLEGLIKEINFIQFLEVGVNFAIEDRAYDIALTVVLNNKDDLNAYAIHPKHLEVVSFIKKVATSSKVVDYEMASI